MCVIRTQDVSSLLQLSVNSLTLFGCLMSPCDVQGKQNFKLQDTNSPSDANKLAYEDELGLRSKLIQDVTRT